MRDNGKGPQLFDRWTFFQWGNGPEKRRVMNNADRRRLGIDQDEAQADYMRCGNCGSGKIQVGKPWQCLACGWQSARVK